MEAMNMNISSFSEVTNIKQSNMSSMLNGKRKIGDGVINKIVLSFDINKEWLLTGKGDMLTTANKPDVSSQPQSKDSSFKPDKYLSIINSQQQTIERLSRVIENLTNK